VFLSDLPISSYAIPDLSNFFKKKIEIMTISKCAAFFVAGIKTQ